MSDKDARFLAGDITRIQGAQLQAWRRSRRPLTRVANEMHELRCAKRGKQPRGTGEVVMNGDEDRRKNGADKDNGAREREFGIT